ncbi:tetratricopeptide repeat protein [Nitzschia inconspicua]|uniref:Tetratricopeptide repeat protein n=1 Tax=Nitzschia inconspicua TaxID=303405 RepID=A0A9K3KYC6_9STRA|nr:tetratricopeptide repeat protein [Nitzschia inconspicua]
MAALLVLTFCLLVMKGTTAFVTHQQPSTPGVSRHSPLTVNAFPISDPTPPVVLERSVVDLMPVVQRSSPSSLHDGTLDWWKREQSQSQYSSISELWIPPANAAETATTAVSAPPTKQEIALLREAFAAFYGTTDRDPSKALDLLSQAIEAWQRQPADELAGLYRVRGDCYMALERPNDAIVDYGQAISLLQQPGVSEAADPVELPASFLGRARAIRSLGVNANKDQVKMASSDYKEALVRSAREEWDTVQELLEDGARTNPYATWEYGMALRLNGDYDDAQSIHTLAANYFDDIGDKARSVISRIDAGIDAAAGSGNDPKKVNTAKVVLSEAIKSTKLVEGRDIPLLQRVIAKEGEGRMALASLEWTSGEKQKAESHLELTCERLDQLEEDAIQRNKINPPLKRTTNLRFNIDDIPGALDTSCSRLKNKDFLTERLEWPTVLQDKLFKLKALT